MIESPRHYRQRKCSGDFVEIFDPDSAIPTSIICRSSDRTAALSQYSFSVQI